MQLRHGIHDGNHVFPFAGSVLTFLVLGLQSLLSCIPQVDAFIPVDFQAKYLFASSTSEGKVHYVKLNDPFQASRGEAYHQVHTFASNDAGYKNPTGLAVDSAQGILYVADPTSRTIFGQRIMQGEEEGTLKGMKPHPVVNEIEAHWVAVDGQGNIFFGDAATNRLLSLRGDVAAAKAAGNTDFLQSVGNVKTQVLYSANGPPPISSVNMPQGVAADNFRVFWTNGNNGYNDGSVMSGLEVPADRHRELDVHVLALNVAKAHGVCFSSNNLFFTDDVAKVYGMKKAGGSIAVMTDKLGHPRGCVWDGDSTIYVADKSNEGGSVFSFAGNTPSLYPRPVTLELQVKDAHGLAIYSVSNAHRAVSCVALTMLVYVIAVFRG